MWISGCRSWEKQTEKEATMPVSPLHPKFEIVNLLLNSEKQTKCLYNFFLESLSVPRLKKGRGPNSNRKLTLGKGQKGFFMSNILPLMLIEMHFCVLLFHQNLEKELPGSKLLLCEEADFFYIWTNYVLEY